MLNGRCATKRKLGGVNATAIGAAQNLPNRDAVCSESFSNPLGLLYTAGRKIYFLSAVPGREMPNSFSDVDVCVAQQNNLAALFQCSPDLLVIGTCASGQERQQDQ